MRVGSLAGSPAVLALLLPIAMNGCLRALPGADAGIRWSNLVFTFADDPAKRTVRPGICAVAKAAWGAGDDGSAEADRSAGRIHPQLRERSTLVGPYSCEGGSSCQNCSPGLVVFCSSNGHRF